VVDHLAPALEVVNRRERPEPTRRIENFEFLLNGSENSRLRFNAGLLRLGLSLTKTEVFGDAHPALLRGGLGMVFANAVAS
jgi:hypothetical protein